MTTQARNSAILGGAVFVVAVLAATLLPMIASSGTGELREIRLVARDMAFYMDGVDEPNPTIVLRPGEQVRIRVRNEDAGMRHDFAVKAWTIASRMLENRGEEDTVLVRAPAERGTTTYTCTPHPKMMSGTLRVE